MTPRVSVILTSYNAGEYLQGAVDSVLEQTFADWELVVVDDNSSDGVTIATLDGLEHRPWIRVLRCQTTEADRQATVRYATLINHIAFSRSSGEFLTFLCGDDYYESDRLERMVRVLDQTGAGVCYGAQSLYSESAGRHNGIRPASGQLIDAYHRVDLNSVMVRRTAFEEAGGFPDRPATPELWREADGRFWRRLTGKGYVFEPVPGGPTDCKRYRSDGVDARVIAGLEPWT